MFDTPSKPKSILDQHAADENWRAKQRRPGYLGPACGVLALAVAAGAWYALAMLKRHDSLLAQSAGVKQSVDRLGGRVEQQSARLSESSSNVEQLRQQISDLRREMRWRIEAAKRQAGHSAEELFTRVQKQVDGEIDGIKAKVARLELSRDADQVLIADLQNQLAGLRKEMTEQTQKLNDRIAESGAGAEREIAGLQAAQEQDRKDVDGLNRKLAIRRIDFEVDKGRNVELAPGISLEISGTDVAYRRVSGWMWVLPDRRTIWLRDQGAQVPVVFYSNTDGKKRELVITGVTPHSAVGYLLIPSEGERAETASATDAASASE